MSSQQGGLVRRGNYWTEEIVCWKKIDRGRPASLEPRVWEVEKALKSAAGLLEVQPGYHFLCLVLTRHLKLQQLKYCGGYSSIAIPKYLRMSQLALTFCLSSTFFVLLFFCHFNDIKSYQKVTLKDTFRRERSKITLLSDPHLPAINSTSTVCCLVLPQLLHLWGWCPTFTSNDTGLCHLAAEISPNLMHSAKCRGGRDPMESSEWRAQSSHSRLCRAWNIPLPKRSPPLCLKSYQNTCKYWSKWQVTSALWEKDPPLHSVSHNWWNRSWAFSF